MILKLLLITFLPVSGCVTVQVRDTEQGTWPAAYTEQDRYYVAGVRVKFVTKPGPIVWRQYE